MAIGETVSSPRAGRLPSSISPVRISFGSWVAAALGNTLGGLGWEAANDLGMTSATIGILTGIFGGIALIKLGTIKGYTKFVKDFTQLPNDMRTGLIEVALVMPRSLAASQPNPPRVLPKAAAVPWPPWKPAGRPALGEETVSPMAIDPLAWHLMLILNHNPYDTEQHQQGERNDVLQHHRDVDGSHAEEDQEIGAAASHAADDPVVHIFVTAIGMALLRIVDPENKSCTLDDAAIVTPIESIIEV